MGSRHCKAKLYEVVPQSSCCYQPPRPQCYYPAPAPAPLPAPAPIPRFTYQPAPITPQISVSQTRIAPQPQPQPVLHRQKTPSSIIRVVHQYVQQQPVQVQTVQHYLQPIAQPVCYQPQPIPRPCCQPARPCCQPARPCCPPQPANIICLRKYKNKCRKARRCC